MEIKLYKNTSDKNKVGKSLTLVKTLTGDLKNSTSIINPVILCHLSTNELATFNYMYIELFKRYYFIEDITTIRNGYAEIKVKVDVLETYKNNLKNLYAIVERQQNDFNMYINDSELPMYNYRNNTVREFPNGFSLNNYYYLTVSGGWKYNSDSEG